MQEKLERLTMACYFFKNDRTQRAPLCRVDPQILDNDVKIQTLTLVNYERKSFTPSATNRFKILEQNWNKN